jgi:hypothetical protein
MAGFADSELRLAQPFGWFDQLSAWPVRKLAPSSRKLRTALRMAMIATIGVGLVGSCQVDVAGTCGTNGVRCLATL